MSDKCKICLQDVSEPSLEEHIAANHADTPESVSAVYPDRYDAVFTDDGELQARFETTPDTPAQPEPQGTTNPDVTDNTSSNTPGQSNRGGTDRGTTSPSDTPPSGGTASGTEPTAGDSGTPGGPGTTPGGTGTPTGPGPAPGPGASMTGAVGNKWLMAGVGGAGNHIMDAVLMRRDTLRNDNSSLASVWEGGLANYGNLNTNITELGETYYAQVDRQFQREALISNCMIGYQHHNYAGAGRNWKAGRMWMEKDFEGENNAIRDRLDLNTKDLKASQAVMLINSVTKGTGCGATPVLAENIRELITESDSLENIPAATKPILSSVVLPSDSQFRGGEMIRGVVGMAYLSKAVDGIIPFDNTQLDDPPAELAVDIDTDLLGRYNPPMYSDINRLLVTFLEAFTMSSTPQSADTASTERINGEVLDVPDSFRPVQRKYALSEERAYKPAVVMAPVIGKSSASSFDRSRLDTLVRSTLLQGQLVDFDPGTAWGGTFMVYGPEEKMDDIAPPLSNNELSNILSGEDFLDRESFEGPGSIDIYVNQLVVPHVDDVYLWGVVWNPRLPTLETMYEQARHLVENSESEEANELREIWDTVEPLFDSLGRENMG